MCHSEISFLWQFKMRRRSSASRIHSKVQSYKETILRLEAARERSTTSFLCTFIAYIVEISKISLQHHCSTPLEHFNHFQSNLYFCTNSNGKYALISRADPFFKFLIINLCYIYDGRLTHFLLHAE